MFDDRQRDRERSSEAREGRLSLGTDALHRERIGLAFALVRPAHRHVRAARDGLQVGGRPDRTKRRNGDPPANVVVRLPVDDLFEGGEAAGHALRLRSDAAPSARRALDDLERTLPQRSQLRRGQVGPHVRRLGRHDRVEVDDAVAITNIQATRLAFEPPSVPRDPA